jgi:DNA-binding IclR family transcriptional regulator
VTLESAACDRDLQVRARQIRDVYETATGRLLLAYLPDEQRSAFVQRVGLPLPGVWPGVGTIDDMERAWEQIRRDELSQSQSPEHIVGLAVPIRRGEQVIASASVYLPEARYTPDRRDEIESALRHAGREISQRLLAAVGKCRKQSLRSAACSARVSDPAETADRRSPTILETYGRSVARSETGHSSGTD